MDRLPLVSIIVLLSWLYWLWFFEMGAQLDAEPEGLGVYDEDWRKAPNWGERDQMMQTLRDMRPVDIWYGVKRIKILLIGPVGAGKSSFINSVKSVFAGHVDRTVMTAPHAGTSCTTSYSEHPILEHIVFSDVMGMGRVEGQGIRTDDIMDILFGHGKGVFEWSHGSVYKKRHGTMRDHYFRKEVNCLVCVVDANTRMDDQDQYIAEIRTIIEEAKFLGRLPVFVILTHPDMACPEVKQDLQNIYRSKAIHTKMEECSRKLGVPMNRIFPVKNYCDETTLVDNIDVLVLDAVTQMMEATNGHLQNLRAEAMHNPCHDNPLFR